MRKLLFLGIFALSLISPGLVWAKQTGTLYCPGITKTVAATPAKPNQCQAEYSGGPTICKNIPATPAQTICIDPNTGKQIKFKKTN